MQPEKKQLEILIIDYFRESYSDFPKGKINPTESPDFTIRLKSGNELGIELTRLNPGNAQLPNKLELAEIEFQEHLICSIQQLFEQNSAQKLFVKFLFSKELIPREKEILVAVQTVNCIRNAIQFKNEKGFFTSIMVKKQLPKGLDEILIVNHPVIQTSIWERSNNLGISTNVVDDIRNAIRKKDEKLRFYQKRHLNFYWLLITTDRLRGVKNYNLPNKVRNHKFESSFQYVFLFDLIKADIYELI